MTARDRARGALLGLAIGDALGAPAENLTPEQIADCWGRIEGFVSETPAGTDDTEFAIFSGLLLAQHGSSLTTADAEAAWRREILPHATTHPMRGAGFSERATVENLLRGTHSTWHRHTWSDGLAMRAAVFGIHTPGTPEEAARLVAADGAVSHAGEGIIAAQAIAAAVATALTVPALDSHGADDTDANQGDATQDHPAPEPEKGGADRGGMCGAGREAHGTDGAYADQGRTGPGPAMRDADRGDVYGAGLRPEEHGAARVGAGQSRTESGDATRDADRAGRHDGALPRPGAEPAPALPSASAPDPVPASASVSGRTPVRAVACAAGHSADGGGGRAVGAVDRVMDAAIAVIPGDSWTGRVLGRVRDVAGEGPEAIRDAAVVRGYPWTDLAPEAVGLAFGALLYARGDFVASVLTAVNMGRDADTTAALAGAVAGALCGAAALPPDWTSAIRPARGTCLPSVAGHHVTEIADALTAPSRPGETPEPATAALLRDRERSADAAEEPAADPAAPARTAGRPGASGLIEAGDRGKPGDAVRPNRAAPAGGTAVTGAAGTAGAAETGRGRAGGTIAARVEGMILGLAVGDAVGWPSARQRAGLLPGWTRRLGRELDGFAEENGLTSFPVPFALNVPPAPLAIGPGDDAEWAAFAALAVLDGDPDDPYGALRQAWENLAAAPLDGLRTRIGIRAALTNLAHGVAPPASGHDNPHFFDDAAAVRAVIPGALRPGDPPAAARLAYDDARITNDGDGVHAACATAAAISAAVAGADPETTVATALTWLPEDTEIGRNARTALDLATPGTAFACVPALEDAFVDHVYSYGVAAAETLPAALALTAAAHGSLTEAVPAAACLSRLADSAPALTGALCGALGRVPDAWRSRVRRLSGVALPWLAGTDLITLARRLADRAGDRTGEYGEQDGDEL